MKRTIILLFLISSFISAAVAQQNKGEQQRLSPVEFREKQQAFITDKAGLTKEEAAKFFPLYFQLQDKKKELNDKAWALIKEGKEDNLTDAQYSSILDGVYDVRIATAELEKDYYTKFKQILSSKKIYLVQKAEMRFHRELLRGMNNNRSGGAKNADGASKKSNR